MDEQKQSRPVAIDTSLLFPMIRSIVHNAECKVIDGKRCFVINEGPYLNIMSYLFASGKELTFDPRIASEGYENVEVAISARDTHLYYLCCKMDSLFDRIWENKGPKAATTAG